MLKGPFWVVNAEEGPDDHQLLSCPVSLDTHPVPSHKEVWKQVRGRRTAHWNYYPRGRIEVRRNKAIVFANPQCFSFVQLEEALRAAFDLGDTRLNIKPTIPDTIAPVCLANRCRTKERIQEND